VFVVAHQQVGQAVSPSIHGSSYRHAQVLVTCTPQVLKAGQHAGFENLYVHVRLSFSAWKSAGLMGTKFTVSPGDSSVGDSCAGSNNTAGVAPMTCQPPGEALG